MHWSHILLSCLLFLHSAVAQRDLLNELPQCAAKCFQATLPTTSCTGDSAQCWCGDVDFITAAGICNAANCTVVETLKSINDTNAACGIPVRDDRASMVGATASVGGLAIIMVILRLAHRSISHNATLGWDDLLIGLSGLSSVIQNVPVLVAAKIGFGKDMWGMTPGEITASFKWLYVTYFMYQVAEALCQLSICAFYLRIMTDPGIRRTTYILMVLVTLFGLGNTFAMAFQCKPIPFFWDGWKGEMAGSCGVDVRLFGFVRGAIEIVLDLVILTLPLPVLANLQMDLKKKLQIMSMFCVGFIITIASCLRIWALVKFDQSTNPTYDNVSGVYWCVTECNLFIVVACMPAMHSIAQRIFGRFREISGYGSSKEKYGSSGPGKGSYIRHESDDKHHKNGSLPFGVISKSMDVSVFRTERSESDIELVPGRLRPDV